MVKDHIRYDVLAQDALRGMLRKLLQEVSQTGLPGDHHFYITFSTLASGVRISDRLRDQYPEEIPIVLQHQFWDLKVMESAFEVGLSFNGIPERLTVPFSAIKAFFDPSVQFGLQFDPDHSTNVSIDASEQDDMPSDSGGDTASPEAIPLPGNLNDEAEGGRPLLPSERERQRLAEQEKLDDFQKAEEMAERLETTQDEQESSAEVVSLDAFRKKN